MNWETRILTGWGRVVHASVRACRPESREDIRAALLDVNERGMIAYGGGRSYGDAALLDNGQTLLTDSLQQVRTFDPGTGLIVCEPGVTFHQLLAEFLPKGYIVPVSPGTGFVTVGGAVANDVHGKNHDKAGSFGDHVEWIDMILPSGKPERVSPSHRPDILAATIGGVGLTGIISAVCFQMKRVRSNAVELREERMKNIDEFFSAFARVRDSATYSVGWIDAVAGGGDLGRGILETAEVSSTELPKSSPKRVKVPMNLPSFTLNSWSVNVFNRLYYQRIPLAGRERRICIEKFFYPLDALLEWNRIYGKRGFYQFQCVLPDSTSDKGIRSILSTVAESRRASFLAVLKTLGGEGRGHLSFPMRGFTLALDFPRRPGIEGLLGRLERITLDHGGRVYLAKDAQLTSEAFRMMYPRLNEFRAILDEIDPAIRMRSEMSCRLDIRGGRHARQHKGKAET